MRTVYLNAKHVSTFEANPGLERSTIGDLAKALELKKKSAAEARPRKSRRAAAAKR